MTRLIQIKKGHVRRVALVEEPNLRLLDSYSSVYEMAHSAIARGMTLNELVGQRARHEVISYDPIYRNESDWKLLPAIDQPEDPARCLISGTGLTHLGSARNRQSMHAKEDEDLTDSMKMFRWGIEGGRGRRRRGRDCRCLRHRPQRAALSRRPGGGKRILRSSI